MFGMVAAERDELFADGTAAVGLTPAAARMCHDTFHLLTARQAAVSVTALARVDQRLDAALD